LAGSHRLSFPFFTAESFLSDLDAEQRDRFLSDLRAAKEASKSGVSVGRAKAAVTVWEIWQNYCADLGIDPFLETIQDKVPILQVFAQRVRTGELAAGGHPILARSVEDYIRHVAQTFLGVGANDPRKKPGEKDIDFRIQRLQAAWKKKDPPPNRVKPVPIQVLRFLAQLASESSLESTRATADMIIIAFFFLLRPGEYIDTNSESTPFTLYDVSLYIGNVYLNPLTATAAQLCAATRVTLTFTTQKNGVRGEVIGLSRSGDATLCPVLAIVRRVLYLRRHDAPPATPLARLYKQDGLVYHTGTPSQITSKSITQALRQAVLLLGTDLGFRPSDVSARSLRAAGANALLLSNVDTNIIRLIGRWRSDEMLRYLHVQAAPLMQHYAQRMLQGGEYTLLPNEHLVQQQLLPAREVVPLQ